MGYYIPNFTRFKLGAGIPCVLTEDQLERAATAHDFDGYIQDWDGTGVRVGNVRITRDPNSANVEADVEVTYTGSSTGSAENKTFAWTIGGTDQDRTITGGTTSETCVVTYLNSGTYSVKCEVSSSDAGVEDSPQEATINQSVFVTIGDITVSGDTTATVGEEKTYTAENSGTADDVVYVFSAPGETFDGGTVIWSSNGLRTVTASATSEDAGDPGASGSLNVQVSNAPVIGAVTVTNDDDLDTIQAGVQTTFSATNAGTAAVTTRTWTSTDASATITPSADGTSADVTFSAAGSFTVTCTMGDGTNTEAGSASMTVTAAAISLTLSSPQLSNGVWDDSVGSNDADNLQSPEVTWVLANAGVITGYSLLMTDDDATDQSGGQYRHWNVRAQPDGQNGGNGIMETTDTNVTIARLAFGGDNNLPGSATPGSTSGGQNFAMNNGFEPLAPPDSAHTYRMQVQAWNGTTLVATSNELVGTYTPADGGGDGGGDTITVETATTFTGTLQVGETLTATPATFSGADTITTSVRWQASDSADGNFIPFAFNSETVELTAQQENQFIQAVTSGSADGVQPVDSVSASQGPVTA